jgi:hypothetical protein
MMKLTVAFRNLANSPNRVQPSPLRRKNIQGEISYCFVYSYLLYYVDVSGYLQDSAGLPLRKDPPMPILQKAGCAPEPVCTFRRK